MDPEKELSNKLKRNEMCRYERQLSLEFERRAARTLDPEVREKYNKLAQEHARRAQFLN